MSIEKIIPRWLDFAKGDLEAAEVLLKSGKTNWSYQLCVLHCHQAIEKILKAIIIKKRREIKKIHDLVKLLEDSRLKVSPDYEEYIKELSPHYQPPRYPDIPQKGPVFRYDKNFAKYHFNKTKEIFLWIQKKLISKK